LWIANIGSNFGSLVQAVGAAWLMTLISESDTLVALVQASTTLPIMAFSLISGAVADGYDRRRVMLFAQLFMLVSSVALTVFTFLGFINAWLLLGFTFLIGSGMAFHNPAWQASVRDFVGKDLVPSAVLLNGVGFNVTRSVAPAIGGSIVAAAGAVAAFVINSLSYLGLIAAVWSWEGQKQLEGQSRERLRSAIGAGVRYVSLSPHLMRIYSRGFLFGLSNVAVLALLPLVARDSLQGDSLTFGILLGGFGVGAVIGGLTSGRISEYLGNEQKIRVSFLAFAVASLLFSVSQWLALTLLAVLLSGWAWVMALALFNTSVQLSTPRWVVGRALSLYQMFTFGGMALGAWVWGTWVEAYSISVAFQVAAALAVFGLLVGFRWPLSVATDLNLDPLGRWQEPPVELDIVPRSGPISIAVEYQIDAADLSEFMRLMTERERIRRRDGARQWTLLRNLEDTRLWIERYELPTWADYVRFHARTTHEDGYVGEQIRGLHRGDGPPRVRRMLVRDPERQLARLRRRREDG
jgi:MFS family permease